MVMWPQATHLSQISVLPFSSLGGGHGGVSRSGVLGNPGFLGRS